MEALLEHSDRYATIAAAAGRFEPGEVEIVGRVPGNAGTEFGVPAVWGPWDELPAAGAALDRLLVLLDASWDHLDEVLRTAPPELRKGPRGGGRDRDAVAEHVRAAERAYAGKVGGRLPPRTPWPEQRAALRAALRAEPPPGSPAPGPWPLRYAIRRCAWHVLDHAWEVEDRSEAGR